MRKILSATELTALLREVAAEMELDLPDDALDMPLADLGMDSLDRFELLTVLEDKSGFRIPDNKIDRIKTVNDVIESILALQQEEHDRGPDREGVSE
jgi:acyl carrier protein